MSIQPITVTINRCKCERCGHEWQSEIVPKQCPNKSCHSPYWNKRRTRPVKVEQSTK